MNNYFYVLLAFSMLVFSNCKQVEKKQTPPNILLIVSEDNGPDLGCYGVKEVTTPALDKLATEGTLFEKAFVTYSVCSPSRGTIFTGLYPHQNGQIGLATHKYRMYESFKTLPVYLKEAGYDTGCIGKIHVNPESAIPFDFRAIKGSNFAKKNLPKYAENAGKFINGTDKPFFLMVNFPDAHYPVQKQVEGMPKNPMDGTDIDGPLPFVGADSERLRAFTANYYNCMNRLDESVAMLLETLEKTGKTDNTIIIYLGDHGAQFSRGKCSNYEAALQVPMIIKNPLIDVKGQRTDALVSSVDLVPTILEYANIETPKNLPGISMASLVSGEKETNNRDYIFAGGVGSAVQFYYPRRSVRGKRFKLIHNILYEETNPKVAIYDAHANAHFAGGTERSEAVAAGEIVSNAYKTWENPPKYELYDLENDPLEFVNLSEDKTYATELSHLVNVLEEWQTTTNDPFADPKKLELFNQEIKDIKEKYPTLKYNRDKNFKWKYPEYFME